MKGRKYLVNVSLVQKINNHGLDSNLNFDFFFQNFSDHFFLVDILKCFVS